MDFSPFYAKQVTGCETKNTAKFIFVILSLCKKQKIHIVILSVSEISTEFKTHFKFKVKNYALNV